MRANFSWSLKFFILENVTSFILGTDTDQYNSTHIPALWFLLLESSWMNATQEQIKRWKKLRVNQIQSLHQIFYHSRLVFTRASSLAGNQFLFFKTSDRWWVVFIVYCHGRPLLHCRHIFCPLCPNLVMPSRPSFSKFLMSDEFLQFSLMFRVPHHKNP